METTVFQYRGFDSDGDRIRFITSDDILPFSIPINGYVKLAKLLDFETKTQHTLENV